MARVRIVAPTILLIVLVFAIYTLSGSRSSNALHSIADYGTAHTPNLKNVNLPSLPKSLHLQRTWAGSNPVENLFTAEEKALIARTPRYAITSSVQTSSFTAMALMLGYSLQKHNDLAAMDAEMVLLVREQAPDAKDGVTKADITRLERAGWKVRAMQELQFEGVDINNIRAHHRHNMNKLNLWRWTEYEKIVFIDADVVCKGSIAELLDMPGDFAASPDVWWHMLVDTRFNSGVIVFRPSMETFHDMVPKVSDPNYHSPNDADQAFLNAYYKFRFFALPYKYNFNLVMYQYHRATWDKLWDEAILVHFTMRKPRKDNHCHKGCNEWEPSEWYGQYFKEMIAFHGWEDEVPVYA